MQVNHVALRRFIRKIYLMGIQCHYYTTQNKILGKTLDIFFSLCYLFAQRGGITMTIKIVRGLAAGCQALLSQPSLDEMSISPQAVEP